MISPHRKSDAQDDLEGVLLVSMDFRFLAEKESEEQVTPASPPPSPCWSSVSGGAR